MGFFRGVRSTGSRARGGDGAWGGVALAEAADARGGSWATRVGLAEAAAGGRSLAAGEAGGEAAGAARADSCRGATQIRALYFRRHLPTTANDRAGA